MRLRSTRLGSINQGSGGRPANLSFTWAVDADGNWSTLANWASTKYYPNSFSDTANLLTAITANRIVTLDVPVKLKTLNIGDAQNYTIAGAATLSLDGSTPTLTITSTGTPTISCPINLVSALTLSNAPNTTLSGIISGLGLTKSGAGILTLSGINTFAGTLSILDGEVLCGVAGALNSGVIVSMANTVGVDLDLNGFDQTVASIAGGGASGGTLTLGNKTLTISGGTTTVLSGAVSGTGGNITLVGASALTLSGINTLTGTITCSATGTIRFGSTTAFGTASLVLVSGSTLGKVTGALTNANVNALSCAGLINIDNVNVSTFTWGTGVITLTGNTEFNVLVANSVFTTTGKIAGAFTLTKSGLGTHTLNSATGATYTDLYILNGIAVIQNNGSRPTTRIYIGDTSGSNNAQLNYVTGLVTPITVRSGSSGTKTIKRHSGNPSISGAITLETDLTIDGSTGNCTFTGGITGTGNVTTTNSSTGTFTISTAAWNHVGNITFGGTSTGIITISIELGSNVVNVTNSTSGFLVINSVSANTGTLTINSGGLGGTGTAKSSATITIPSGATLIGGSGASNAGTLTTTAGVTLSSGAIYTVNVGSTTTVSKVAITGAATFNGNTVNFQVAALNAGTYTIFTHTGTATGTLAIGTLPTGRTFSTFTYNSGSTTVTFT